MSERKKILFILHLPPPVHGAAVVGSLIAQSELILNSFDCKFINLATASGLGDIGKFKFSKISRFYSLLQQIRHTIKEFNPDLIYITPNSAGNAFYKDWIVVRMLKHTHKPVIAHFHNKGVARNAKGRLKTTLYSDFFKNLNVILLSKYLWSDIERFAEKDRTYFCPNGIPDTAGGVSGKYKSSQTPRLLFLSNLLIDKGVLLLLDALSLLNRQGADFICDIAGGETAEIDRTRLEDEIASRSLTGKIIYHGPVYRDAKNKLFANSDIFIFPTRYKEEAFPLVCLEAMQHSLPIITSDEGGIPDMVIDNHNGIICNPLTPDTLASSIASLLSDPELRRQMGAKGRTIYETKFTDEVFQTNLYHILNKNI